MSRHKLNEKGNLRRTRVGELTWRLRSPCPRASPTEDRSDGSAQWDIVKSLIPAAKHGGRHRRSLIFARYSTPFFTRDKRLGLPKWDMLPHDLLPKSTVYDYFKAWRDDGTLQKLLDALREAIRQPRETGDRRPAAVGCIDSQTIKTTEMGGDRGASTVAS